MRRDNDEYKNAGCEAYIGEELKKYGRRMQDAHDFWVCIISIAFTCALIGYLAGALSR